MAFAPRMTSVCKFLCLKENNIYGAINSATKISGAGSHPAAWIWGVGRTTATRGQHQPQTLIRPPHPTRDLTLSLRKTMWEMTVLKSLGLWTGHLDPVGHVVETPHPTSASLQLRRAVSSPPEGSATVEIVLHALSSVYILFWFLLSAPSLRTP